MKTKLLLSTAAIALTMGAGAFAQSPRSEQPTDRPAQARQPANAQSQRAQTERIPDANRQGAQQSSEPRRIGQGQAQSGETTRAPSTAQRQSAPSTNARTADPNSQPSANRAAQGQQAQPVQRQTTAPDTRSAPQGAQRPSAQAPGTAQSQPADTTRSSTSRSQTAQTTGMRQGSAGTVALNTEQQTRISQTLTRHNVQPLTNVNFSISVGTTIPRSVRPRALTPDLVTFVPQYRGYSYFVAEERIVIVEPRTHRIVALVPYAGGSERVSGGKAMVGAPMTTRPVSLGTGEREVIRRHVRRHTTTVPVRKRYVIGETVPSTVVMESFPEVVYTEAPTLRPYRYFVEDDDVILVDPSEHRIVEIIR